MLFSVAFFLLLVPYDFNAVEASDPMHDVKEYIKLFNTFASPSGDFGDAMHKIGHLSERAAGLIGLSVPVANLLAAVAHTQPHEEVIKAMQEFRRDIFTRLNYLELKNGHLIRDFKLDIFLWLYMWEVQMPLYNNVATYKAMLQTGARKNSTTVQDFIERCRGERSPLALMRSLNVMIVTNCPMPTTKRNTIFTAASNLFNELATKNTSFLGKYQMGKYEHITKESVYLLSHLSHCYAMTLIEGLKTETINRKNVTSEQMERAIWAMHKKLHEAVPPNDRCLLETVIVGGEWRRDKVFAIVEFLKNDLLVMQEVANKCTNISRYGDTEEIIRDREEIEDLFSAITQHLHEWCEQKMSTFWPSVAEYYINITLMSQLPIEIAQFNQTAQKIRDALDPRGTYRTFYNVLISENWDHWEWVFTKIAPNNGLSMINRFGINLYVFRYNDFSLQRSLKAKQWIIDHRKNIVQIIDDFYVGGRGNLQILFNAIVAKFPEVSSPTFYPSVVILHNLKYFAAFCVIQFGFSCELFHGLETYDFGTILYKDPGVFYDAAIYRMFFFL